MTVLFADATSAAVVVLGVSLFWLLARVLWPYREVSKTPTGLPAAELSKRYAKWELAAVVPILIFSAVLAFLWSRLFLLLQRFATGSQESAVFYLAPIESFWLLIGGVLGIVTCAVPMHFLYGWLLGERYAEYLHYTNLHHGFDGWRTFRWLALILTVASVSAIVLAFDCYTSFTDHSLVANPFFSFGAEEHAYVDIAEIRYVATFTAPNGNVIHHPFHEIVFRDGFVWSSRGGMRDPDSELDERIVTYVSRMSGKPVVERWSSPP